MPISADAPTNIAVARHVERSTRLEPMSPSDPTMLRTDAGFGCHCLRSRIKNTVIEPKNSTGNQGTSRTVGHQSYWDSKREFKEARFSSRSTFRHVLRRAIALGW